MCLPLCVCVCVCVCVVMVIEFRAWGTLGKCFTTKPHTHPYVHFWKEKRYNKKIELLYEERVMIHPVKQTSKDILFTTDSKDIIDIFILWGKRCCKCYNRSKVRAEISGIFLDTNLYFIWRYICPLGNSTTKLSAEWQRAEWNRDSKWMAYVTVLWRWLKDSDKARTTTAGSLKEQKLFENIEHSQAMLVKLLNPY
jgi:hypothetical protein